MLVARHPGRQSRDLLMVLRFSLKDAGSVPGMTNYMHVVSLHYLQTLATLLYYVIPAVRAGIF